MANIEIDLHVNAPLDTRSELVKAQSRAVRGKVNACPFGCGFSKLDENGYCRHLIGFSNDQKTFEPMVYDPHTGRRVVKVARRETGQNPVAWNDDGVPVMEAVFELVPEKIQPDDVLVRITSSYRVYRDVGKSTPQKRFDAVEGTQDDLAREALAAMNRAKPEKITVSEPTPDFAVAGQS